MPYVFLYVVMINSDNFSSGEAHVEDYCRLKLGNGVDDRDESDGVATVQLICEIDLTCWNGWSYYTDTSGTEGRDSCYRGIAATPPTWTVAQSICPIRSHLLTSASTSESTGLIAHHLTSIYSWHLVGCSQSPTATLKTTGWSWVDGTPSTNLNCGSSGCGVWQNIEPKYVSGYSRRVLLLQ